MDTTPATSSFDAISANLRMVLRGLLAALGAWKIEPVIALVLYRRISATMRQIEPMLVRFRAGKLWRVRHREAAPARRARETSGVRLPRKFGWLVLAGGHQAACFGGQLQAVLNAPEIAELLAASAQAARVLRPLCRALALELPGTADKARAKAADGDATKPRKRKPRPKPEPFKIPLPRGMLTWARREGFGKMV